MAKLFKVTNPEEKAFLEALPEQLPVCQLSNEEVIKQLRAALAELSNAIGLHARQIGINANIFVIKTENFYYDFINPANIKLSGDIWYEKEKCFSEVDSDDKMIIYNVGRSKNIIFDTDEKKNISFSGYLARVCQHEIDHTKGLLLSKNPNATVVGPFKKEQEVGRNDPCPCKSGKKYKKCCGKNS